MIENYNPPKLPLLTILYQDETILVFNKPSGLLSVPGRELKHRDSLQSRVQSKFDNALTVHRLDMDTSGIIIMAIGKDAHRHLSKQFQNREVNKSYIARVYGEIDQNEGLIYLPLICDWQNRPKQMVDFAIGKPSQTTWKVIRRSKNETRLRLIPITGRSHQLRVHLQHIGHPILGDRFYAQTEALQMSDRLCLHSESLTVIHPKTSEKLTFNCSVPF